MTTRSARAPVLNSLLFIRDGNLRHVPQINGDAAVWSTESCVAVTCLPDCDGDTEITLVIGSNMESDRTLLFDGRLRTPSRRVIVETVLGKTILETSVPNVTTRVQVWTNGLRDTDKVVIAVS
jgi:hypothetical protein